MKEIRILEHDADLLPILPRVERAHIDTVDAHHAARRVVEARHETHDRRLAAAGRTYESDQLARLHLEAHAAKNLPNAVVGERHVVELHPATYRREPHRVGDVAHLGLAVEHLEDAMRR